MRSATRGLAAALGWAAWALPAAATAEEAPAPKEATTEVHVIGSKADSLQKIPGSGTLVGTKDFERTQPYDAVEMLRRVPGLNVRQEEGSGYRLDIGIRGLDPGRSRRTLVLEDGIPVAINPYAESDLYYSPPVERMRGIEVVKGSGSILFGPQTLGGVVNFLTLAPPSAPRGMVEAKAGQRNFAEVIANYGDAAGPARYVVQAFRRQGDGFRDQRFEATDVFGKLVFDTSDDGVATLKLGAHDHVSLSDDVGLTRGMFAADPRRATLSPHNEMKLQRYEASLVHEQRFSQKTKLKTLVYAYTTARVWRRQDYTRVPAAGDAYERIAFDPLAPIAFRNTDTILDRSYDVLGLEPRAEHRFKTGPVEHTLDFGARALVEGAHYQQRSGGTVESYAGSLDFEETHRTLAFAGYAQDRVAFRPDLLVTPGFRVEHARFRRALTRQLGASGATDVDVSGTSEATGWIPGIGIIYGTRAAHAFGGVHVGWAPPRVVSSITARGLPGQVDAERSLNYEIGARAAHKKLVRGEATGFVSAYSNQVIASGSDTGIELTNGGHTRSVGAEGAATLAVGGILGWPTVLDLSARYTFVRATFAEGANRGHLLPYAPMHAGGATLDLEHRAGFGAQLGWSFVGAQFTDPENTVAVDATGRYGKIPLYHTVDALARYRHARSGISATLSVKNALDDVYVWSRRPEGIWTAGFRQVMLGVRWDFAREAKAPSSARLTGR